ncbi:MAG: biopolymer transporter ExbD [Gammaproteobacteria bacterium]|nr:biopolymer transporter ExbD [Gammaproteobacteria bacterium]
MRFTDRTEEELQINLTPLIDVVFLLLIFFMVSTTFSKESQLRIQLPEASVDSERTQGDNLLEINIGSDGQYAIRGPTEDKAKQLANTTPQSLRRALKLAAGGRADLITVIRADRRTPHEAVIRAMDTSRRLGYTNVTFATQQDDGKDQSK